MKFILIFIFLFSVLISCKTTEISNDEINERISENFSDETKADNNDDFFIKDRLKYEDYVYLSSIKSVELHGSDWIYSLPVYYLNQNNTIDLTFDDLSNDIKDFRFTYILCNALWEPVDLLPMEYLEGFFEEEITDYVFSRNTLQPYIHYKTVFPTENIKIVKSGNYILKVWYNDGAEDKTVITRRFYVSEQIIGISANVKKASDIELRNYQHEIDFEINTNGVEIINPYQNLTVVLQQNGRYDNVISNLNPRLIKGNIYDYNFESGNIFNASNEFRHFDMKSLAYNSDRIASIKKLNQMYHVYLKQDERRPFQRYISEDDINGRFLIKNDDGSDSETEGEYIWVHFFLSYPNPISDGGIYLMGSFSDWSFSEEYKLEYDFNRKGYSDSLLLKQGYYNYYYVLLPNQKSVGDDAFIEGRHYEADNDYTIYVYYREPSEIYDRLLGVLSVNSRNN